jgi:hypothetical protein
MGFGVVTKYIEVSPDQFLPKQSAKEKYTKWDEAIEHASMSYDKQMVKVMNSLE